jgi:hypothetical protein
MPHYMNLAELPVILCSSVKIQELHMILVFPPNLGISPSFLFLLTSQISKSLGHNTGHQYIALSGDLFVLLEWSV